MTENLILVSLILLCIFTDQTTAKIFNYFITYKEFAAGFYNLIETYVY